MMVESCIIYTFGLAFDVKRGLQFGGHTTHYIYRRLCRSFL